VNSVIFKVEVDGALAKTIVLGGALDNWLLEKGREVEDLKERSVI